MAQFTKISGGGKGYIKEFTKADFQQVGAAQRYYIAIKQAEHGLKNPYVSKILINRDKNSGETTNFKTSVVAGERTLSTGTIKVYITVDLSKLSDYSGKIYLAGE